MTASVTCSWFSMIMSSPPGSSLLALPSHGADRRRMPRKHGIDEDLSAACLDDQDCDSGLRLGSTWAGHEKAVGGPWEGHGRD
jgi:hypothetical protein